MAAHGWEKHVKNSIELHKATYYPLRALHPNLPSQLVISARMKAAEAIKSAFTWKAKRESHRHRHSRQALQLYPYAMQLLKQGRGCDSADLIFRRGRFWLPLVGSRPEVEFVPNGQILGVDFGVTRPAVASTNQFLGKRSWKATECRYFRLKGVLQNKGTKSARRQLQQLSGRTAITWSVGPWFDPSRLALSLSSPAPSRRHRREPQAHQSDMQTEGQDPKTGHAPVVFHCLRDLLTYKAEAPGCAVMEVDPRHASQRCSRCGYIKRSNRRSQAVFKCRQCGFELHGDLNAGRNLALQYHASVGQAIAGGLLSTSLS